MRSIIFICYLTLCITSITAKNDMQADRSITINKHQELIIDLSQESSTEHGAWRLTQHDPQYLMPQQLPSCTSGPNQWQFYTKKSGCTWLMFTHHAPHAQPLEYAFYIIIE